MESAGLHRLANHRIGDVLDVGDARPQASDLSVIDVETNHGKVHLDRSHGQREPHVALTENGNESVGGIAHICQSDVEAGS